MAVSSRSRRRASQSRARARRLSVLVTGGSGGIGRAICLAFGQAGWRVAVHYHRREREAKQIAALIARQGGEGGPVRADLRDGKQVHEMVDQIVSRWGRLDVLVCNAGLSSGGLVLRMDPEAWTSAIETNLTGTFHCLQAAGPVMLTQRDGSVVVVGSFAGLQGRAGQAAYAAAKAGLFGLVKAVALEWGDRNVRINAILPGWHRTELSQEALPDHDDYGDHALGRPPGLEEVARSIYHLALLKDVSGQIWNLDSRIS